MNFYPIDRLLNNVTMYRLVVYGLGLLAAVSLIVSLTGRFSFSAVELLVSAGLLVGSAFGANVLFAKIWNVPVNRESWLITALILLFVLQPAHDLASAIAIVLAGAVSSASKFILAPLGKHIFNPAAFAAAVVSLTGILPTTWWVGTSALWPFTLLLGFAIILKIRRYALALGFIGTVLVVQSLQFIVTGHALADGLIGVLTSSPLLFLGGVMVTEPSTMPPNRTGQSLFGVIVGALFVLAPEVGPFIVYPEVALLIGNAYAYAVGPKRRYRLTLQRIEKISPRVYNYVFKSNHNLQYRAGQYMEWTLAGVPGDGRGNRRSFTIASSPTESTVQVGLKYYNPSSTFKNGFAKLKPGDSLYAGQISGSFTLAGQQGKKLAFIAGGVGITPFRSMVKQITDEKRSSDIVVVYSVSAIGELAYTDVFRDAARYGVRFVPVAPNPGKVNGITSGPITSDLIRQAIPDFDGRTFFVSGPNSMVQSIKGDLKALGVHRTHVHTDYFSGY